VRNRHREFNVAHPLTTNASEGDFDTAAVADHAFVLDPFVFATRAFPVPRGTEDALAEEAAFFRLKGPVVDGLRILNFAVAPGANGVGCSHRDGDLVKANTALFTDEFTKGRSFDHNEL
jgi:hypothetical protein